jgi:hypothetical protein
LNPEPDRCHISMETPVIDAASRSASGAKGCRMSLLLHIEV